MTAEQRRLAVPENVYTLCPNTKAQGHGMGRHKRAQTGDAAEKTKDNKEKRRKGGKDSQLLIRIARDDHAAFMEACQRSGTSAAREIRRFIRDFTERAAAAEPVRDRTSATKEEQPR